MLQIESLIRDLGLIREKAPLVHNITNYVVMNNTANALLAIGASPVMAHSTEEVAEMASIASSIVLNIGTIEPLWVDAMLIAGQTAGYNNIPVVFDPVGAGATQYRNRVCQVIIESCSPAIIRGNASEIKALINTRTKTKGVDSTESSDSALDAAIELASETNSVVVISGDTDYITNGNKTEKVIYGNPMMARVTGMGCTATAIVAAFAAVNPDPFEAAFHGMTVMGIAGQISARISRGNGSLQINFLDELFNLDRDAINRELRLTMI